MVRKDVSSDTPDKIKNKTLVVFVGHMLLLQQNDPWKCHFILCIIAVRRILNRKDKKEGLIRID